MSSDKNHVIRKRGFGVSPELLLTILIALGVIVLILISVFPNTVNTTVTGTSNTRNNILDVLISWLS